MTRHPDEGTLHAFIDGELPQADAAELKQHVAACAQCASALAEARGLTAAASRAVNALDGAPTSASRAAAPVRSVAGRVKRPSYFRAPYLQAAAVLLLAASSAIVIDRSRSPGESIAADAAREVDASAAPVADEAEAPATQSPEQALTRPAPAVPAARRVAVAAGDTESRPPKQTSGTSKGTAGAANMPQPTSSEAVSAMAPQRLDAAADRKEISAPAAPAPALALAQSASVPSASLARTTRYRLESGVVLTLVDEPLDSVEARQRTASARRFVPSGASAASTMASLPAGPAAGNSYRWVDTKQRRAYVLSGPVTEEMLKAAASRLGELQRLP